MGYPLREARPGAYYHVGTRGNNQRPIYTDDHSRLLFFLILGNQARKFDWRIITYCLMGNHYHLVMELGQGGLSRGMQRLNGGYARAFNIREGRRDHLFGRRFWSREIEDEGDLLATCRYVDLNPTRSFGVLPQNWPWSGHRGSVRSNSPRSFHSPTPLWDILHAEPRRAMDSYESFVAESLRGSSGCLTS